MGELLHYPLIDKMKVSQRLQTIQSPIIPIVGQWIRESPGTISLGQGIVNYGPPDSIKEAIMQFGQRSEDHIYQAVEGIPELLEEIERKVKIENGIDMTDRKVLVTAGGNMGFLQTILAICDPGDEVIIPVPYYFNHEMALGMANIVAVPVQTLPNFQLDLNAIEAAIGPKTKAIITVSPNNPAGVVYPKSALEEVNQLCKSRGLYHITDEAYEYFIHGNEPHFSPASIPDSHAYTISIFSLSKAFGFASWRIGYTIIPAHLHQAFRKIQDTNLICASVITQRAAVACLQAGKAYAKSNQDLILQNRSMFQGAFDQMKDILTPSDPQGAFYYLIRIHQNINAEQLAETLIRKYKVATIPGTTFGLTKGCYLRIAYAALESKKMEEGIERLMEGLRKECG